MLPASTSFEKDSWGCPSSVARDLGESVLFVTRGVTPCMTSRSHRSDNTGFQAMASGANMLRQRPGKMAQNHCITLCDWALIRYSFLHIYQSQPDFQHISGLLCHNLQLCSVGNVCNQISKTDSASGMYSKSEEGIVSWSQIESAERFFMPGNPDWGHLTSSSNPSIPTNVPYSHMKHTSPVEVLVYCSVAAA